MVFMFTAAVLVEGLRYLIFLFLSQKFLLKLNLSLIYVKKDLKKSYSNKIKQNNLFDFDIAFFCKFFM